MLVLAVAVLCFAGFAPAEEGTPGKVPQPAKMKPADILQLYAPYVVMVRDGEEQPPQADQQPRRFMMRQNWKMGVMVNDGIFMYPIEVRMRAYMKTRMQPGDVQVETVAFANGKKAVGDEVGMRIAFGLGFASVEIPEGAGVVKLDTEKQVKPSVGDTVYLIGRRGEEWKFTPYFLPAVVNGELDYKGTKLYSLTLPQTQLQQEGMGALVVREDGEVLGVVSRVDGKRYSVVVVPLAAFKDDAKKALDAPEELDQFDDLPDMRVPRVPGRRLGGGF
ncbi:MAG: hypothetical protein DRP90_07965 [Planctomycetota bacterium]|nr:MAG: hypothetical protein DRP90_07965 [Planctomycetota bacterium]